MSKVFHIHISLPHLNGYSSKTDVGPRAGVDDMTRSGPSALIEQRPTMPCNLLGYYLQLFAILSAEILIAKHNRCYRLNKRVSGGVLVALINNVWSVVTNFNLLGWKRFVLIIIGMGQPGVFGVNQHSNCGRSAACHLEQAGL